MDVIDELMQIYQGHPHAHGKSALTGKVKENGKMEASGATVKSPITRELWERHLDGTYMMGFHPLRPGTNDVRYVACDIDIYKGQLSIGQVLEQCYAKGLKCVGHRSKSGGMHLALHIADWVEARVAIAKMDMIAAFLSYGTHEIFPRSAVVEEGSFGNYINLPYFKGIHHLRTAFDREGKAITDLKKYVEWVKENTYTKEEFEALEIRPNQLYPEGPPCINSILARDSHEGLRNDTLFACGIMLKKEFPESWREELDKANQLLRPPLDSREVENIKKSHEKKDWDYYPCNKAPFNSYCDRWTCKKRKFGIGGASVYIVTKSLTKVMCEPPVYFLDVEVEDHIVCISLTSEELSKHNLFRIKCFEATNRLPAAMKQKEWDEQVNAMAKTIHIENVPFETTAKGQLHDLLDSFLQDASHEDPAKSNLTDCLLGGWVHVDASSYYFRMKDFLNFIKTQSTVIFKSNYVATCLRMDFAAISERDRSEGSQIRYIKIAKNKIANRPINHINVPEIETNEHF